MVPWFVGVSGSEPAATPTLAALCGSVIVVGAEADFILRWGRWLNWWTLLCLPGTALVATVWGIRGTILVSVAIGFLTFLVLSGFRRGGSTMAWTIRWIFRVGACAAAAFLSLIVVAQWGGPLWLLLGIAMALTSPPGRAALQRVAARFSSSPALPPAEPPQFPASLGQVGDVDLCCLWRHTFWDLGAADSPAQHAEIVAHRQEILDELIRRNSTAIDAWLATEPRASESPERFFRGDDHGHAAAA